MLKMIYAKRRFPVFIRLVVRASETGSSDLENEHAGNPYSNYEKLCNIVLITILLL